MRLLNSCAGTRIRPLLSTSSSARWSTSKPPGPLPGCDLAVRGRIGCSRRPRRARPAGQRRHHPRGGREAGKRLLTSRTSARWLTRGGTLGPGGTCLSYSGPRPSTPRVEGRPDPRAGAAASRSSVTGTATSGPDPSGGSPRRCSRWTSATLPLSRLALLHTGGRARSASPADAIESLVVEAGSMPASDPVAVADTGGLTAGEREGPRPAGRGPH